MPLGWENTTILQLAGQAGLVTDGDWIESKDQDPAGDVRLVQLADIGDGVFRNRSERYVTSATAARLNCTYLQPGDLLIARMPDPLGRACIFPGVDRPAITAVDVFVWRAGSSDIVPRWLMHFINSPDRRAAIASEAGGTTRNRIAGGRLKQLTIPTPPLAEQRRIVAKIDSLSAKSKRARVHLDRVERLAQKYKEAILSAAFSGHLTAHWRANNPPGTTVEDRLAQLRSERSCIGAPKTRSGIKARKSTDSGRVALELNVAPPDWGSCTLEEVTSPTRLIQYGILKPGDHFPDGIPYVKVMNIKGGKIDQGSIRRTSPEIHYQYRRASIKENDILLTIRGTVGRLAFVPPELDGGNITQDSVRIDVLPAVERNYVFWFLHSPIARAYFASNMKGVAVRGINVGDVRLMEVPLPDRTEQIEIVSLIEKAFAWIDRLAAEATNAYKLIDHLDQAVLSKAFRGELVAQDLGDEPASVLLERIKGERTGPTPARRGRGRPRLASAT